MRDRWAALIPPLLCCLLADLCLVILPFRPHDEQPVILAVVVLTIGSAFGAEIARGRQQQQSGVIDLRALRRGGADYHAFVILARHTTAGVLLGSALSGGVALCLLISTYVDPVTTLSPAPFRAVGYTVLGLCGLSAGLIMSALTGGGHYLALSPEGLLVALPGVRCFIPWGAMTEVSLVKPGLLGRANPILLGIRVADPAMIQASAQTQRRMARRASRGLWPCLLPIGGLALSPEKLAVVVKGYSLQPQEQPKIGTPKELETIRAVLSRVPDRQER